MTVFHIRAPGSSPQNPKTYCGRRPETQEKTAYPLMVEYDWVRPAPPDSVCINCLTVVQGKQRRETARQDDPIPF